MRAELESTKSEELEKIKHLTKAVTESQIKLAAKREQVTQVGGRATKAVKQKLKKQIKRIRKTLSQRKKKLSKVESGLRESKIYQLFKEAKPSLLEIPG